MTSPGPIRDVYEALGSTGVAASASPIVERCGVGALMATASVDATTFYEEMEPAPLSSGSGQYDFAQSWQTLPDSGGTIPCSNNLRAELAAERSREAYVASELTSLRHAISEFECEAAGTAALCQHGLSNELQESLEHGRLTEEYAERLQAVADLRGDELRDARSELETYRRDEQEAAHFRSLVTSLVTPGGHCQDSSGSSMDNLSVDGYQRLLVTLHDCEADLGAEKDKVLALQQELDSANREKQQLQETMCGLSAQVAELEAMFRQTLQTGAPVLSLPLPVSLPSRGERSRSAEDVALNGGSACLPTFRGSGADSDESCRQALQAELAASLQQNAALEQEVREALEQEREFQQAFFEQGARLRYVEASAAQEKSWEQHRERSALERHEAAWREEASVVNILRTKLESKQDDIGEMAHMLQSSAREITEHKDAAADSAEQLRLLQLELRVQVACVQRLSGQLQQEKLAQTRNKDNPEEEFDEHLREVKELASTFRSELSCVQEVRKTESACARKVGAELETRVQEVRETAENAHKQVMALQNELDLRDREIERLRAELRAESPQVARSHDGAGAQLVSCANQSVLPAPVRSSSARSSYTAACPSPVCIRTVHPVRTATPPARRRIPVFETVVRSPSLGSRTPPPATRTPPPAARLPLQAESAETVHERLRRRISEASEWDRGFRSSLKARDDAARPPLVS